MSDVTILELTNLDNPSSVVQTINVNNDNIKDVLDDTLSRTNATGNAMSVPLDMNGQRITNLPVPSNDTDPARHGDLQEYVDAAEEAVVDAEAQVALAEAQADIATTQAGIATTQAGIATTQAGNAATSADEAQMWAETADIQSEQIDFIVVLTETEYDNLGSPASDTLYLVTADA